MRKTLNRLIRVKKLELDAVTKKLEVFNIEQNQLRALQSTLEGYLNRESELYDKMVENHPILPLFLNNITLRQRKIMERMREIDTLKEECVAITKQLLLEGKQIETIKEKFDEIDKKEQDRKEQALMDEFVSNASIKWGKI